MEAEGTSARQAIIRTAIILSALTACEFVIAFTKHNYSAWTGISPSTVVTMVVILFVILTIFKAFYIVGEFMHLRHEVKRLIWTIGIPFVFIIWLIIGMMLEGGYWGELARPADTIGIHVPFVPDFVGDEQTYV
jgi:cytochrome c oxidase subunit IV